MSTQINNHLLDYFKSHILKHAKTPHVKASQGLLSVVISSLDSELGREPRIAFLSWLFDRTITTGKITKAPPGGVVTETTGLKEGEAHALLMWAKPTKITDEQGGGHWLLNNNYHHYMKTIRQVFTKPMPERICTNCGIVSDKLNTARHCPKCAEMFIKQFELFTEGQEVACRNCSFGLVELGENIVSREMAIDAGDPSLEGVSLGIEFGICSCCQGDFENCENCKQNKE